MAGIVIEIEESGIEIFVGDKIVMTSGSAAPVFVSLTISQTLAASASGTRYNNTGTIVDVLATLPPATVNQYFSFRVSAALNLGIAPAAGESILLDAITVADTQQLQCAEIGAVLDLECHDDGVWIVTNIQHAWALEVV